MDKFDMSSASLNELTAFVEGLREPAYRGRQIFEWINSKGASTFGEMTNIPRILQEKFVQIAELTTPSISDIKISKDGQTRKYLLQLQKYGTIGLCSVLVETVLMSYKHGKSVCVSSQVGCRMGCVFCASGAAGLKRNLTAGEIAAQYYQVCKDIGERIPNIVIMGVGEPLDNFDNVVKFIRIINDKNGANIGQRHITLSTCGIVRGIYDLLKENLQITLAVSLNGSDDKIRQALTPIAKANPIDAVIEAARAYEAGLRRVTFEYIMIANVTDAPDMAKELCRRLKGMSSHINLIPFNAIPKKGFKKSSPEAVAKFAEILKNSGFSVSVRRELGGDISAACGQLLGTKNFENR